MKPVKINIYDVDGIIFLKSAEDIHQGMELPLPHV